MGVRALQRRGFRLELSADDESVVRVTSPGGNTLDHPSLDELRHLLRGISIRSLSHYPGGDVESGAPTRSATVEQTAGSLPVKSPQDLEAAACRDAIEAARNRMKENT